jgi:DNA-binding MarR family transcriptional regulator
VPGSDALSWRGFFQAMNEHCGMTRHKTVARRGAASRSSSGKVRGTAADPAAVIGSTVSIKIIRIAEALNRSATRAFGTLYDLKNTDWRILVNLSEPAPVTIGELSRRVRIDKAWISRSLTHLRERKLVRVSSDPRMPRAKLLSLTQQGKHLLAQIAPVTVQRAQRLLAGVDQAQAEAMLDRIWLNVSTLEDEEIAMAQRGAANAK